MIARSIVGPARILISASEPSELLTELGAVLKRHGYLVEIGESASLDGYNTIVEMKNALAHVNFVVFVVTAKDVQLNGKESIRQRFAHKIGLTRGSLEMDSVMLLIEQSEFPIFDDVNIDQASFTSLGVVQAAETILGKVTEQLGAGLDLQYVQRSVRDQLKEPDTFVGFLLVVLVFLVGANSLIRVLDEPQQETANDQTMLSVLTNGNETATSLRSRIPETPIGSVSSEPIPFSPVTARQGNETEQEKFPVTCKMESLKNQLLAESFVCENIGNVQTSGIVGPWHNNIRYLVLDPGVVVEIYYESGKVEKFIGDATRSPVTVDSEQAEYGIVETSITFSAANQQVSLHRTESEAVRLVFVL